MDLLYPVRKGSAWKYNELRYSLRSASENMPHDRVIIAGYRPAFIHGVAHVAAEDPHQDRQRNIQSKILKALRSGEVGEVFALMCDDIYILAPWTCNAIRQVGKLSDRVIKAKRTRPPSDQWRRDLVATMDLIKEMGLSDSLDYGTHHPVVMERDKAIETLVHIAARKRPVCMVHAYVAMHGADVVKGFNSKVEKWRGEPTLPVLSTGPEAERSSGFRKWITSRFPAACRYEGGERL